MSDSATAPVRTPSNAARRWWPATRVAQLRLSPSHYASAANFIRGGMGTLATLAVTLGMARVLTPRDYNLWSIYFTIASFALYLEVGAPLLANRLSAREETWPALLPTRTTIRAVRPVWIAGALIAIACGGMAPWFYRAHGHNASAVDGVLTVFLLVAGNLAFLAGNIAWGEALGRRHRLRPAFTVAVCGRLAIPVLTLALARVAGPLLAAATLFVSQAVTALMGARTYSRGHPAAWRDSFPPVARSARRLEVAELRTRMRLFAFFAVAMLLIAGLDTPIVGKVDFRDVGAYAAAAAVVNAISGIVNAICAPMIGNFSRRGRTEAQHVAAVRTGARVNSLMLAVAFAGVVGMGPLVFHYGLPSHDRRSAEVILPVLAAGVMVRQTVMPALLLALSRPTLDRRLYWTSATEAISNFTLSVILGSVLGAVGVAVGTLLAAVIGVSVTLPVLSATLPRDLRPHRYLVTCASPATLLITLTAVAATIALRTL